jgi:formate/nitrite transporter
MNETRIDALLPAEMAARAEYLGVQKAETSVLKTFALSVLAGSFIAMGSVFATTTAAGSGSMPYGAAKLMTGFVFCLGLVLVVVAGAELFTGNNLIVMAWANRKVGTKALLRNWAIVYVGNFVGSVGIAILIFLSEQYSFGGGAVGETALKIAVGKVDFSFIQAVSLGTLCNTLVCLAVWLTFSARTTVDKIVAVIFPVTAFVAAGFEHSIANMYFIPFGLLIKQFNPSFVLESGVDVSNLTWGTFLVNNLIPVTIGNIIGGAVLVSATYWAIFLRKRKG